MRKPKDAFTWYKRCQGKEYTNVSRVGLKKRKLRIESSGPNKTASQASTCTNDTSSSQPARVTSACFKPAGLSITLTVNLNLTWLPRLHVTQPCPVNMSHGRILPRWFVQQREKVVVICSETFPLFTLAHLRDCPESPWPWQNHSRSAEWSRGWQPDTEHTDIPPPSQCCMHAHTYPPHPRQSPD